MPPEGARDGAPSGGAPGSAAPAGGVDALADAVLQGDKRAVARALNLVEDRRPSARDDVAALLERLAASDTDGGHRVGMTGPPGVGKSSLCAALGRTLREAGRSVGVVAIDPSSVRSGGSLLGDRARMSFDPGDEGFFVRSLATGGQAGGLSYAANSAARVLGAAFDVVLIETTGVGQSETDVMHLADTVALVIQPGSGDALQFLKAGIMEIPDVLIVNKADQVALARRAVSDLRGALRAAKSAGLVDAGAAWEVPIVPTSAETGRGLDSLAHQLALHHAYLLAAPGGVRARRLRGDVEWTLSLFAHTYGAHGVSTLGGRANLRLEVRQSLEAGETALRLVDTLGQRYLDALRTA
ncbi:MAG: methylmalonyl Co-A mutase-associated GTPase MeaB [Myxococcales bacterium]|nr:methylmalonyl Co-A mutase-associated GTPase MeaB [Myxococcales bacterium]